MADTTQGGGTTQPQIVHSTIMIVVSTINVVVCIYKRNLVRTS